MNPEELGLIDSSYHIDRAALRRLLEEAIEDQRKMEELAEKHSCELPAWVDLAATLEARLAQSSIAIDQIVAETMELDESVFEGVSREQCVEIVRALGVEFERALKIRIDSARLLISFARNFRAEGYQGSEIVDGVLTQLVRQLVDANHVPGEVAVTYIALLARDCGAIHAESPDPARALAARLESAGARFPDLTGSFSTTGAALRGWRNSGRSFEEIANDIQQTALGLWPK
jgi:hypothetical protein